MNEFFVSLLLLGAMGSSNAGLPYWMTTNCYGLMPETNGSVMMLQAGSQTDSTRTLQWRWGASLAANAYGSDTFAAHVMVDELYGSLGWKQLSLDIGPKHRELDFLGADSRLGSLSVTGGHVAESPDARTMPGYQIRLDPLAIPLTGNHLWIYGAYGDYKTIDKRYVQGALVHRTRAMLRADITPRLSLHAGLDHYALWAGHHPDEEDIPVNLGNYIKVVTGSHAGASGNMSDRINVIGDQGGGEVIVVEYRGDGWTIKAQHDIPYADGSGMGFQNFPDGINTLHFGYEDKDRWISDLLYEHHYTMFQSGPFHEEIFDEEGHSLTPPGACTTGVDNYFNNGYYRSGWTHFGHAIGDPLCFPAGTRDRTWTSKGITLGFESNRYKAHHFGMSGKLWRRHPYKLMLTCSKSYGTYFEPYEGQSQLYHQWGTVKETGLSQLSAAFTGVLVTRVKGLSGLYGLFFDHGELLPDNFGVSLGIRYSLEHWN